MTHNCKLVASGKLWISIREFGKNKDGFLQDSPESISHESSSPNEGPCLLLSAAATRPLRKLSQSSPPQTTHAGSCIGLDNPHLVPLMIISSVGVVKQPRRPHASSLWKWKSSRLEATN